MGLQATAAVAATGQALQERRALPHGATRLVRPGPGVGSETGLVGLVGSPIDEALMVLLDQHLPLRLRQVSHAVLAHARCVEHRLPSRLPVGVGARINWIAQDVMDRGVAGLYPADLSPLVHLQRERQPLRSEPQPDTPRRTGIGETREDRGDRCAHGFVGVKSDFAVGLAPNEADRQASPKLSARRLVADAAVEAGAQDVKLRLAHRALEPEKQPVVEESGVINAVGIADQRVGQAAKVDQPIPVGIVAGQPGDLQAQDQAEVSEGDFGGQAGETGPRNGSRTG